MGVQRALPLALGALAVASGTTLVTFDIVFAVTLSSASAPKDTRITAIVASGLESVTTALLLLLLGRQIRYQNGAHIQDFGHGRQHTYLLAALTVVFGTLSVIASALWLGMMGNRISGLPKMILGRLTESMVVGGFIVWAVALLSEALFIICMVIIQRRDFQQHIQPYQPDSTPSSHSEMQETRPRAPSVQDGEYPKKASTDSKSRPSSNGRSRASSDTRASFRSSLSQVVRPITSKTKLISQNKQPHRLSSESRSRDTSTSMDDGFDSWDTSTVDAQSRQTVESASPTPQRILETIPASPTTSRSPSPGFPLDLQPPKPLKRSRSFSPANSYRDLPRTRTSSPTESMNNEAHIHPLFRTDSPTPPPPATPGTVVTAAPGAGQVISDRASIRSIHRMRSGSLPSSPLLHQDSLDSIRKTIEREEQEKVEEAGGERTLTPPIPDWILSGAPPRNSMSGYNSRRKPAGLGKVGEVRES